MYHGFNQTYRCLPLYKTKKQAESANQRLQTP